MKKMAVLSCAVVMTFPVLAHATTTTYYSAQLCTVEGQGVGATDQGAVNPWDWSDGLYCPALWTSTASNGQGDAYEIVDAATLVYTDTSSGAFACHVIQENWDGSVYSSGSLYSCPTYGGCGSNSNPGWQGPGQLNFTRPISGGSGFYSLGIAFACTVPGSGSVVRGYNFSLN